MTKWDKAKLRTVEVHYEKFQTMKGIRKQWVILGQRGTLGQFDTKSKAVKNAKQRARNMAEKNNASIGLKIFGKDGDYQRQHVYEP